MTTIYLITNDQVLTFETQPKLASGDENSVTLQVDFDEAWSGFAKSAVFFTENNKTVYEIIMVNDQCVVPWEVLTDAGVLYIGIRGVISNQAAVKTSTLVKYRVVKGAPVGDGTNIEPTADVYQQMLSMMDTFMSAEELAERAETAAATASSAAKSASTSEGNAKTYATNAQTAAATATTKASETASARDTAVAAKDEAVESAEHAEEIMHDVLRGNGKTASGEAIRLENVLSDPYFVKVTARSKNLFDGAESGHIDLSDGQAHANAIYKATSYIPIMKGVPYGFYTEGMTNAGKANIFYYDSNKNYLGYGAVNMDGFVTFTPPANTAFIRAVCYAENINKTYLYENCTQAADYVPYVDVMSVKSRNLIPYPYSDTTKTVNGITFTDNKDGRITVNGTATAQSSFVLIGVDTLSLPKGTYFLSGCPSSGSTTTYCITLSMYVDGVVQYFADSGKGLKFTVDDTHVFRHIHVEVKGGVAVQNIVFFPMINYGSTALPFEKYFEPRPLNVSSFGKNLLPYPYKHGTTKLNGVTFTDNGDGSITVKGTATANCFFQLTDYVTYTEGAKCFLSGCPSGGATEKYFLYAQRVGAVAVGYDMGSGVKFTASADGIAVLIAIYSGQTVDLTFYPQIELGDTATEYEPYKAGETFDFRTADQECDFVSVSPNMTLLPDASGVVLEAVYNDTHAAFEKVKAECEKLNKSITALSNVVNGNLSDIDTLKTNVTTINSKISNHRNIYVTTQKNPDVGMYQYGDIVGVIEGTS